MARKRGPRKGDGTYWYDKKNKRHVWTLEKDGKRYRIADRDEETASVRFEALKRQIARGISIEGARSTVKDYLESWIDTEVTGKQSTIEDYHKRGDLYIYPTLGEIRICDLKRRQVVAWVNGMMNTPDAKGKYWSRESIKQALGILRRGLDSAVPELLEYNPAAGVKVPLARKGDEYKIDQVKPTKKVFTAEEMQRVLDELWRTNPYHHMYTYFALVSETGARRGEGLGLRRKDVNFDELTITIAQQVIRSPRTSAKSITTPKSESGKRELPISAEIALLLKEQCVRVGAARPNDLLFPGRDGTERQPSSVTQLFRRTCDRLGFEGYTLHSVRHYRVTIWRTAGVDLEVASALAGHKGVKVTAEVYSQATMERKRSAIEKGRQAK